MRRFIAAVLLGISAPALAATSGTETGTITVISGSTVTVKLRTGSIATVDAAPAQDHDLSVGLYVGEPITARGSFDVSGVLRADAITRAKPQSTLWPIDTVGLATGMQ